MIIFDDKVVSVFSDYGIMLPVAGWRARKIVDQLGGDIASPSGHFPGPVLDIQQTLSFLGKTGDVIGRSDIERVHSPAYVDALFSDSPDGLTRQLLNAYELIGPDGKPNRYEPDKALKPLSALFDKILAQCAGSYLACAAALSEERHFCYFLAGGNHHARYDTGAGFCLINEIIIAARKLQAEGGASLIWIIDVDVHKGCGSAELVSFIRSGVNPVPFEDGCDILTLSIHMARGWPLDSETLSGAVQGRAPLLPSDVDIPIGEGEEALYISRLEQGLDRLEQLTPQGAGPGIAIVVDGADPYEHDELLSSALMRLPLDQCVERDMLVYNFLRSRNIPSAWIMAGGYGERAWEPPCRFLQTLGACRASRV
ncbi:MAG: histone deacetylase [Spirochaetaceae bacterium]|jgi:acetoin utilization deacetylase AcuC-like enzyme|nr:histone deacetylase [Spirochaetaceae bacterium]